MRSASSNTTSTSHQLRHHLRRACFSSATPQATSLSAGTRPALCENRALPTRPFLYASSEGQAGIIAQSLHDGLSVIVDLPYWHDCLKFSGRGQLAEMQQVVPLAESDLLADRPQIVSRRQALRSYLDFQSFRIPFARFIRGAFAAVRGVWSGWLAIRANRFTVKSNPDWRRRLELQT